MRQPTLILSLVTVACGPVCNEEGLDGVYVYTMEYQSGDCSTETITASAEYHEGKEVATASNCSGNTTFDEDSCTATTTSICLESELGMVVSMEADFDIEAEEDGTFESFEGDARLTIRDAETDELLCAGTYLVSAQRQ